MTIWPWFSRNEIGAAGFGFVAWMDCGFSVKKVEASFEAVVKFNWAIC